MNMMHNECTVHSLLDFFSKDQAKKALHRAKPDEIYTNYVNMHYQKSHQLKGNDLA